jgi:hypothetical protein
MYRFLVKANNLPGFAFIGDRRLLGQVTAQRAASIPPRRPAPMSARCRDQATRGVRPLPRRRDFARVARAILREPSANLVRIVAARPPSASGTTTTIPFPPDPFPLSALPHGRPAGGATLL